MPGMPAGFASGPPPGGSISPSQLASQAAYTVLGNPTASPASPIATTDPVVSGSATAARFLGSANNTAAAPTVLLEPSGNSGLYWDATTGVSLSVDAVARILARVSGTTEVSSGQAGTVPVFRMTSTSLSIDVYATTQATPEGVITAATGSLCVSVNASVTKLWLKKTGTGNTGWVQIDRCESGTYTPTATIVTNLDSVTPGTFFYQRVGDVVAVFGVAQVDPTASGSIVFRLSLPVASNFAAASDAAGAGQLFATFVQADATNDAAAVTAPNNTATSAYSLYFSFSYRVL